MNTYSIYQLVTPSIDGYAKFSIASVKSYAEKHSYEYFIQRSQLLDDMHINWSKIVGLINIIKQTVSDYVVLLDADTVIVDLERTLDEFSPKGEKIVTMARDTPILNWNKPNAGFMIFKSNPEGLLLLEEWLYIARNEGKEWSDIHPRNQNVYWRYIQPNWESKQSLLDLRDCCKYYGILPYLFKRRFVYHVSHTNDYEREIKMEKIALDFVPNLNEQLVTLEKILKEKSGLLNLLTPYS